MEPAARLPSGRTRSAVPPLAKLANPPAPRRSGPARRVIAGEPETKASRRVATADLGNPKSGCHRSVKNPPLPGSLLRAKHRPPLPKIRGILDGRTLEMSESAALSIRQAAGNTRRKSFSRSASDHAPNSPDPISFDGLGVLFKFARDLVDVVSLRINRETLDFDRVFNHHPRVGRER